MKKQWDLIIELFKDYTLRSIAGLSFFKAGLAKILLKYALIMIKKLEVIAIEKAKAKKEKKSYEKVLDDPNSTASDIRDSGSDFLK